MDAPAKVKSFWERKEGTTGVVFLGLVAAAVLVTYAAWLPALVLLLQNTIYAGFLMCVIAFGVFSVFNPQLRSRWWGLFQIAMHAVTSVIVELDPIAIVEGYVQDMKKERVAVDTQVQKLDQARAKVSRAKTDNERERQKNLNLAASAQKTGQDRLLALNARSAGRLQESNVTLDAMLKNLDLLIGVLKKMAENADFVIEDTENDIKIKKREREILTAGASAVRSAMAILRGDPDKRYMFDQGMDYIVEDIGNKLGEIQHFMDLSSNVMKSIDLQNEASMADGIRQLEDWTKSGHSSLLGSDKTLLLDKARTPEPLMVDAVTKGEKKDKYSNLLET